MTRLLRTLLWTSLLGMLPGKAEHVVISGGPALRKWENLRVPKDRHDAWWANFVRAATLRMDEIRVNEGADARLVWMVFKPGYETRGREDGKPYTKWIAEVASKRRATLIWFDSGPAFIRTLNARPRRSVVTLDYFGHSNRHALMFDYGNTLMAASSEWLHERDLPRINSSVFARGARCKSWGCHSGESMSKVWKSRIGIPLEGAKGATDYTVISFGRLPVVKGSWSR